MASLDRELEALGRNIQDVLDRTVNARNLESTIRTVVDKAVDIGGSAVRGMADAAAAEKRRQDVRKLYGSTVGKWIGSVLKMVIGFPGAFVFGLTLLFGRDSETGVAVLTDLSLAGPMLVFSGLNIWLSVSGMRMLNLIKRFKTYCRTLGDKTHCSLEKLAWSVNKSEKFVLQDLRKMIAKGFFREGHLDHEQSCLITSHETFRYYEQSRLALEQRQKHMIEEAPKDHINDPKLQQVIQKGNEFICRIRKCNDDIPGEEVSAKIYHMEMLVKRIFQRAQTNPEVLPDMKKLMDYYLPMTVKLLTAYADMDAQPVQGETILASKREIEGTLDTLNAAYEKLLDELFMDTALDVSSDISVLNTLLAQEGLTTDGLNKTQNTGTGD